MIKGIEHVGLAARDTARLSSWYIEFFGMREVKKLPNGTRFLEAPGGGLMEVYPAERPNEPADNKLAGWRHIAILVEDFQKERERLEAMGVRPVEDPIVSDTFCFYLLRDPEGNLVHLVARSQPLVP